MSDSGRGFDATALPKAELHVHLGGAFPLPALRELAVRNNLPGTWAAGFSQALQVTNFDEFERAIYEFVNPCIPDIESIEFATNAFFEGLAQQNVRYAEVFVTPAVLQQLMPDDYLLMLDRTRAAASTLGVEIRWIYEIWRNMPDAQERRYWSEYTLDVAVAQRTHGVVALGLSGSEVGYPAAEFAPLFDRGRSEGLHSVPHAGELAGSESVRAAVELLNANRVAHGVRAIEDPDVLDLLRQRNIALDVCPTSNVTLGVYPSLAAHPIADLHRAGVAVTVNTDDPTIFSTTLTKEIEQLHDVFGLSPDAVRHIVDNGFRFGFDAPDP